MTFQSRKNNNASRANIDALFQQLATNYVGDVLIGPLDYAPEEVDGWMVEAINHLEPNDLGV